MFLLVSAVCQAQEPNTILNTPYLDGGFNEPQGVAVTPNGQYAYVCNYGESTVSVIDVSTNSIATVISGFDYGPQGVAITPDGKYAYVTNNTGNSVSVINLSTNSILTTIPGFNQPVGVAITPDGKYAYVCAGGDVKVIDVSTNTVSATITGLDDTAGIAVTPDGQYAYVTIPFEGYVVVIKTKDNSVLTTITGFSEPQVLAITPDNKYVYVGNTYQLKVITIADNEISTTISGFNFISGISITPNGQYAYVTNFNGNSVSVIDLIPTDPAYNTIISTPGLESGFTFPAGIAITPNGSYAYVTNLFGNSVNVIFIKTPLTAPVNFSGCKRKNSFLTSVDNYNHLTWFASSAGTPVSYQIYRDAALTQLVATVPVSGILQYDDHNRNPNINYTYYIVAVDGSGDVSEPVITTVTQSC